MTTSTLIGYAGGYGPKGEGLYGLYGSADGAVQARLMVRLAGSPSWLTLSPDGQCLYALLEEADALVSLAVDPLTGALTLLGRQAAAGSMPVQLSLAADHAWVAHYGDGRVSRHPLLEDRQLGAADRVIEPAGSDQSSHPPSHAHMVRPHPAWPLLLWTDLGRDGLCTERLPADRRSDGSRADAAPPAHPSPSSDGTFAAGHRFTLPLPARSGPRHFVFYPHDPSLLYLLCEQANRLDTVRLDASGAATVLHSTSTLPDGFAGTSYASDLLIDAAGQRLFALNRLHDAIAVFELQADGSARWMGEVWAQGSYPRSAAWSADGRQLWVSLQHSDQIAVFDVPPQGLPQFTRRFIAMPGAACVVLR